MQRPTDKTAEAVIPTGQVPPATPSCLRTHHASDPCGGAGVWPDRGGIAIFLRVWVLAWCLWLLGSWVVVLRTSAQVPLGRGMIHAVMMGVMLLWPAFRLSQDFVWRGRFGSARILVDWLCMIVLFQAVLWPLRLMSNWAIGQVMWLNAAVAAWGLLAAAIVAWGCRSSSGLARALAMAVCVLLLLGEPAVMGLASAMAGPGSGVTWAMCVSPIQAIWFLSSPPGTRSTDQSWAVPIVNVAIVAGLAWGFLWLVGQSEHDHA